MNVNRRELLKLIAAAVPAFPLPSITHGRDDGETIAPFVFYTSWPPPLEIINACLGTVNSDPVFGKRPGTVLCAIGYGEPCWNEETGDYSLYRFTFHFRYRWSGWGREHRRVPFAPLLEIGGRAT